MSTGDSSYGTPNVVGSAELLAKKSAVDEYGQLRRLPIEGVLGRLTSRRRPAGTTRRTRRT